MTAPLTAIDFNAGIGGHSLTCTKSDIEVVTALENDPISRDVFKDMLPHIPAFPLTAAVDFPAVDIIFATISAKEYVAGQLGTNESLESKLLHELFYRSFPKAFLIKVPYTFLRTKMFPFLNDPLFREYTINYQVLREENYSDLPISGTQIYVVGTRDNYSTPFHFPEPTRSEISKPVFRETSYLVDPWYRKIPNSLYIPEDFKKGSYLYRGYHRGRSYIRDRMETSRVSDCYFYDEEGVRRITHEEYAWLKGYPDYPFNKLPNRTHTYKMLHSAPDLHVTCKIIDNVIQSLGKSVSTKTISVKQTLPKKVVATREKKPIQTQARNTALKMHIDKLKGLKDLDITFGEGLTAIMGVNGAGKSTILHALACMFAPADCGEDHKFNFFFTPTPDASWQGSSFSLSYRDENTKTETSRKYSKSSDRWTPKYASRPKKDVYYYGIDTGLPEIEKERQTSFINYLTAIDEDKLSGRVAAAAAEILGKDYQELTNHKTKQKSFFGVQTKSGITYSSLSMGAGEQRVIKILTTVFHAKPYSMILIDELDLLLHCEAQYRLVEKLTALAKDKHLQIIFTTHSLEIGAMSDLIQVQYLSHTREKTLVYNGITPDIVFELSHSSEQPLEIYVEDDLAEVIVSQIAKGLHLSRHVKVRKIGSASNAFTVAASLVIQNDQPENILIVLDGDVYRTHDEKIYLIKKVFSGTETDHERKLNTALSMITQFVLPEDTPPEKYIYDLLLDLDSETELTECAKQIMSVNDSHEWLNKIIERMHQDRVIVLFQIIQDVAESEKWANYIAPIRNWLIGKRNELNLNS